MNKDTVFLTIAVAALLEVVKDLRLTVDPEKMEWLNCDKNILKVEEALKEIAGSNASRT